MKTKYTGIFFLIVIVISMSVTGCKKKAPQMGGVPEVAVAIMKTERLPVTTELSGRTSAYLIAEVRPQVNGIIQKRLFDEGEDVKAGQELYLIDKGPYEAAYNGSKAALARAEANAVSIRNRAERYKELVSVNAVSKQEHDDAQAALKQAQAEIEAQKAALENARINLTHTSVTAPISGRVGKSNVTVGALATAYQPISFTTIQQIDPIYVDVTQSSASLLDLQKKMAAGRLKSDARGRARVKLILEDGTIYASEGTLKFSDVSVDPNTGSFVLRMVFPNPKHILLPGMYVRSVVQEGIVENAILVPQEAVSRDLKGNAYVLVVNDNGKVDQRMVSAESAVGNKWFVSSGLKAGDRVIVEGFQKVRPGVQVRVAQDSSADLKSPVPKKTK